ncbi:MAG: RNA 2',3'-cyclic phosphodiesterase [Ignavibacteria bacterium]
MDKLRIFLSLNIDSSLTGKISEIQDEIKSELKEHSIKWENPEKFHLTLRFLDSVYEETIFQMINALNNLRFDFEKIIFQTNGINFFPNKRKPNVVFINLKEFGDNTAKLTKAIDEVLSGFGFQKDKDFVPHITIGRFKREKRTPLDYSRFRDFDKFNVEFNSFFLMKSVLDYKGSKHYPVKEFKFKQNT